MTDIKSTCYPPRVSFNFFNACVFRALVLSIAEGHLTATVQWSGPVYPELAAATNSVEIDSACVGCLLPDGVEPPSMWLCVGDRVLVLDSMITDDPNRWLIIGLDRQYHSSPVPAACFMLTGLPISGATYGEPWFTEEPEIIDGVPTGYTKCVPVSPDINGNPRGTVTNTGTVIPVVVGNQVTSIKEYMLPNFSELASVMQTSWPIRIIRGYAYRFFFPIEFASSRNVNDLSVTLTVPVYAYMICPRSLELKTPIIKTVVSSFTIAGYYDMLALRWDETAGFYGVALCGDWGGYYLDNNNDLHLQFVKKRIKYSPVWLENGALSEGITTYQDISASTTATTERSRTQTYIETGKPEEPEHDVDYYVDIAVTSTSSEANSFGNVETIRDYPEFNISMTCQYSTSEEYEQNYTSTWRYDESGFVEELERVLSNTKTFSGIAIAEYFLSGNKIGEWSTQATAERNYSETYTYPGVPEVTSYDNFREYTSKGCFIVWSCPKAIIILSWNAGIISANVDESSESESVAVSITVNFVLNLFDIDGNSTILEQWSFSPGNQYIIEFNVGITDNSNMGAADSFPDFPSVPPPSFASAELDWSDTATKSYTQVGVPYEFPKWGRVFSLYVTHFTDALSLEISRHLGDKFSLAPNFSVFFGGRVDRITGLPMVEMLDLSVGGTAQLVGQVLLAPDQKQLRVRYNFDGVTKTRLFHNGAEVDYESLRGA